MAQWRFLVAWRAKILCKFNKSSRLHMPRGSKPGEYRGGRRAGVPNRATIERALVAERQVAQSKANGNPLAKEVLESAMLASMKMAQFYAPTPAMPDLLENVNGNDAEFLRWLRVTIDCATKLAPYQSPALRAIYLETKDHKAAVVAPKTHEDVLALVEARAGVEGRNLFEQFITKIRKLEETQQNTDAESE